MAHKSGKHKRGLEQQRCCLAANIERRGKAEKTSTSAIPPHKNRFEKKNQVDTKEPLIDTWPQGGGGMETAHLTPDGCETVNNSNADRGTTNRRPVTDRRLALSSTTGTSPIHTGAELCAPTPTWEEQTKDMFIAIQKNCRGLCDDDRVEEAIAELQNDHWDAIMLSETWRKHEKELWETADGHLFAAAGHDTEGRGDKER